MHYLKTSFTPPEPRAAGLLRKAVGAMLSRLDPNPDYVSHWASVRSWFIEFDDSGHPLREIGFDAAGAAVIAGPDSRNYGYWLDTGCMLADLTGEAINQDTFELAWRMFFDAHPDRAGAS